MPLLLFILVPLIELYFIIVVGDAFGAFWTVLLVVLTAIIGLSLMRIQGMSTLIRAQRNMAQGQTPAVEMLEGIVLAIAGVLLIVPGFITDTIGFLCLIPAIRRAAIHYFLRRIATHSSTRPGFNAQSVNWSAKQDYQQQPKSSEAKHPKKVGHTIEGEYRRED